MFSTVLTGIGAGLMGGLLPLNVLGELVSSGTLLAFVTVCIGIMVLRVTKPELPRPFRVQWVWFVGIGGTLFCGLMLASLFMTGGTWYRIVGWTIIGVHRSTSATATSTARCAMRRPVAASDRPGQPGTE